MPNTQLSCSLVPRSEDHYDRLGSSYDDLWKYSDYFVRSMARAVIETLDLRASDRFVDLGAGTGLFAKAITDELRFAEPILCVDPSARLVNQARRDDIEVLVQDANAFAASGRRFDKLLLKEVVHHLDDPAAVFRGLGESVSPNGAVLVVLLPPTIDYPLFQSALQRFEEQQPHYDEVASALADAGLEPDVRLQEFPLEIERDRYLEMVRSRYMSLLSTFSDNEIRAGVAEIAATRPEPMYRFTDRFVFVVGRRRGR